MKILERMFGGMSIAASGLAAERTRIDVIAENIANARTTRTPEGGPYRRKVVTFAPLLQRALDGSERYEGVAAAKVEHDLRTPFNRHFEPGHPDGDADGLVTFPNVNMVLEMADLVTAMRAYEANLAVQENFVRMAQRALQLAR